MLLLPNHHNMIVPYPFNCLSKPYLQISLSGPLLTKRTDVSSQDVVKSRSREIRVKNVPFALKFDRHLGSSAGKMSVKTSVRFVNRGPGSCSTWQWCRLVSKNIMLNIWALFYGTMSCELLRWIRIIGILQINDLLLILYAIITLL